MNGILVFNKPEGITSHDVVYLLRKRLGIKKIGHTGTLDPMATGVLVMGIGKGTKIIEYLSNDSKEYVAKLKFGYETDTLDSTGIITETSTVIPNKEDIELKIREFIGNINQIPPMYSALKVNGRKLYELARAGEIIELQPRKIFIESIKLLEQNEVDTFTIKINCSSGTYIRSLIRDIGHSLDTYATMESLIRTKAGNFNIEESITSDELDIISDKNLYNKIINIPDALKEMLTFEIPDDFYDKIINGVKYKCNLNYDYGEYLKVYCKNKFIGIGQYELKENISLISIKKQLMGE